MTSVRFRVSCCFLAVRATLGGRSPIRLRRQPAAKNLMRKMGGSGEHWMLVFARAQAGESHVLVRRRLRTEKLRHVRVKR